MGVFGTSRDRPGAPNPGAGAGTSGARSSGARTRGAPASASPLASLWDNVLLRVTLYYGLLVGVAALLWRRLPAGARAIAVDTFAPLLGQGGGAGLATAPAGIHGAAAGLASGVAPLASREPVALTVVAASVGAFLLALPVAWVYMYTRQKKGYRQSVVHTLVLLPVVVAGVVVLVKNSLALAFATAAIVAAVRFRNTLEDSKDAVYIFFMTALGLAAGVELDVAVAMSLTFNALALLLWMSDFARTPPPLEGSRAQRRLERAVAIANRTSQFVARVDREVLDALAPEQLEALARRVDRRRTESSGGQRFDARLRLVTSDAGALRPLVEPVLESSVKRWRFRGTRAGQGVAVAEYDVRWRKGCDPSSVTAALREKCAPFLVRADLEPLAAGGRARGDGAESGSERGAEREDG